MKKILFATTLLSFGLFAQEVASPQQVQAELDQAQRDFEIAKKMFLPWYTGPLITGSAENVPDGMWNVQGYMYFNVDHGEYDNSRCSIDIPNIWTIQPLGLLQRGLTDWLDATVIATGFFKWSDGEYAQTFADMNFTFGFQVLKEGPYVPNIRLSLGENFPTGRYKNLSSKKGGLDASGSGAFETVVGIDISKVFWQFPLHPVRYRFAGTYEIPNHDVFVKNFNAYGGGFGTRGDVCPPQTLNLDMALEVSLTKKWVFAGDVAYTYSLSTSFSGNPGMTEEGLPASVGGPSSDQLSLAPAIEYNVSDTGGFIGGIWFTVTGRNSANFAAIVLSYTQLF